MEDDRSRVKSVQSTANVQIDRRTFGQTLGMATVGVTAWAQSEATRPGGAGPDALCDLTAVDLAARLRRKEVSARDVMRAHLARIERVNPRVNAIVTLAAERALDDAARADE